MRILLSRETRYAWRCIITRHFQEPFFTYNQGKRDYGVMYKTVYAAGFEFIGWVSVGLHYLFAWHTSGLEVYVGPANFPGREQPLDHQFRPHPPSA